MKWLVLALSLVSSGSYGQCKSYRVTANNDTINCIDYKDRRQGKWSEKIEGLRGEPGRDEEGVYVDGKKEGVWRIYTGMGDLFAIERYRWGNKDGKCQYFNIAGIVREESWKAVNPANPYDTIDVVDPVDPNKIYRQVIKLEGSSVKHGAWNYYEDGLIAKTENYVFDRKQDPFKGVVANEQEATDGNGVKKEKAPVKSKPKEVLEFEKKVGKKKVKVIDGTTF